MNRYLKFLLVALAAVVLVAGLVGAKSKNEPRGAWLGVYMQTVDDDIAKAFDLDIDHGVIINGVVEDSPAEEAGLKVEDIIISIDGQKIWESDDLEHQLEDYKDGDKVDIVVLRDGKEMTLNVKLIGNEDRHDTWTYTTPRGNKRYNIATVPPVPAVPGVPPVPDVPSVPRAYHLNSDRGYMGVSLTSLSKQLGDYFGVEKGRGALITEVAEDSPAMTAGLMAGDVIVDIEGERITDAGDVTDLMNDYKEGDKIDVTVMRNHSEKTVNLEVGEYNFDSNRMFGFFDNGGHNFSFNLDNALKGLAWTDDDNARVYVDSKEIQDEIREAMKELQEELKEVKKLDMTEMQNELKRLAKELDELRKKVDD